MIKAMRFGRAATSVALLPVIAAACAGGDAGGRRFLSLGTAGTGGIYYPLGGAIASRMSVADTGHQYTAEVTGGSVENVNRVVGGEMDMGFSMATTVYEAYTGGRDFAEPLEQLRIVAPLYPNVTHVLVSRSSDALSVADLVGKRVSVGSPGSGTEQLASQVLEAYGIGYDDIEIAEYLHLSTIRQPLFVSGVEGVELLFDTIATAPSAPQKVILPVELVARGTTAPLG